MCLNKSRKPAPAPEPPPPPPPAPKLVSPEDVDKAADASEVRNESSARSKLRIDLGGAPKATGLGIPTE